MSANPPSTPQRARLPIEVWLIVQPYLKGRFQDRLSLLSLSYTCKGLFDDVDQSLAEDIFERYPSASSEQDEDLHEQRSRLLSIVGLFGALSARCGRPRELLL